MVHTFEINGCYFALDVESGALHMLEKPAFEICSRLKAPLSKTPPDWIYGLGLEKEEAELSYSELYSVYEEGLLFAPDFKVNVSSNQEIPVKALCLHAAHDCNMRCGYCFASAGGYHGERSLMDAETGKKAIDFLIEHSAGIKHLEVDYFGGEPLLALDAVKEITAYGKKEAAKHGKHIDFTLTTNGMLLDDETIEYLHNEMFNLVLSADGRKEVNDSMRKIAGSADKSVYELIMPRFKKTAELRERDGKSYYIRGTFTSKNVDFMKDVLHFADYGFKEISVEPVALEPENPLALKEEQLEDIFNEYEKLAAELVEREKSGKGFNFFHFMVDLEAGPCAYKRVKGCGAGSEYLAVTPTGELYPCHQFAGMKEYLLGDVYNGFNEKAAELRPKFRADNIYTKPECQSCFAKFFCGGGCAAANVKYAGGLDKCYEMGCKMQKKRLECALYYNALTK